MKGHVPTPAPLVDLMVGKLFHRHPPRPDSLVVDPGCGDGPFIDGVLRYCKERGLGPPRILGVESDSRHLQRARVKLAGEPTVTLREQDYLTAPLEPADYVIGNPPYVAVTGLSEPEKRRYRATFSTAVGRFDLYILFMERSLTNLKPGGRMCFVTPEKFLYVHTAAPLRRLLARTTIEEIHLVNEESFPGLVTYPTITILTKAPPGPKHQTRIAFRDGTSRNVVLTDDGAAWSGVVHGGTTAPSATPMLKDVCLRVSCGIATGCDGVFVQPERDLPAGLRAFAHPTIAGRQLGRGSEELRTTHVMLVPYDGKGDLLPENRLGDLRGFLGLPNNQHRLKHRTCVTRGGRVWYRFHDTVPLGDILRPKILCKDIAPEPHFWADREGSIVPRHSVYYIVPRPGVSLEALLGYLNGDAARAWMTTHCQRAANGFYRLQSEVLKNLPVPEHLLGGAAREASFKRSRVGQVGISPRLTVQTLLLGQEA